MSDKRIFINKMVRSEDKEIVAVFRVPAIIPDEDPTEACLEPDTLWLLDRARELIEKKDKVGLRRLGGTVYSRLET